MTFSWTKVNKKYHEIILQDYQENGVNKTDFIDVFNPRFEKLCQKENSTPLVNEILVTSLLWLWWNDGVFTEKKIEFGFFFLSGFSFTNIHNSQDSRGSGRLFL